MGRYKLRKLFEEPISGEWGNDDITGDGVYVLRTTNFTRIGEIDYSNVVKRDIDSKKIVTKKLKFGDLIIEKSGGGPNTPVGRVVFFNKKDSEPYLCNNFTTILRPKTELVNSKYIFYNLLYFYQIGKVKKYQNQTTGLYNLKLDRFLSEEVELPDIYTQEKIVAYLDRVRKLVDKRNKTIQLLDEYNKSVFLEMFLENPDSKNWDYHSLKNTKGVLDTTYGTAKKANIEGIGIPVLRMNNISNTGEFLLGDIKWVELNEHENLNLKNRQVLFNRTNSPELVGKIGVWDKGDGYTFAGYLIRLELDEKIINPYYFSSYFNSDFGKKILSSKARLSGSLANISATTLLNQEILLPPIELQRKYENIFLKIEVQKALYKKSLQMFDVLFQSSLQSAFSEDSQIEEEEVFESILRNLSLDDLKLGNRLKYLLNWLNKESSQFSNFESYDLAWDKLRDLLEQGSIEQVLEKDKIKLKIAR